MRGDVLKVIAFSLCIGILNGIFFYFSSDVTERSYGSNILSGFSQYSLPPLQCDQCKNLSFAYNLADVHTYKKGNKFMFIDKDLELISCLQPQLSQIFHEPSLIGPILTRDEPWEGREKNGFGKDSAAYWSVTFFSVVQDPFNDGRSFMFYRCPPSDMNTYDHPEAVCVAISTDGIQWKKTWLYEFFIGSSPFNNILLSNKNPHNIGIGHNPFAFRDTNPSSPIQMRMIGGYDGINTNVGVGLFNLHKKIFGLGPITSNFDSIILKMKNLPENKIMESFYDAPGSIVWNQQKQTYQLYVRCNPKGGVRETWTAYSNDLRNITAFTRLDTPFNTVDYLDTYHFAALPYRQARNVFIAMTSAVSKRKSRMSRFVSLLYSSDGDKWEFTGNKLSYIRPRFRVIVWMINN